MRAKNHLLYLAVGIIFGARGARPAPLTDSPKVPFTFVENAGQANPDVRYIGNGPGFKAWFEDRLVIFQQGEAMSRMEFVRGRSHPIIEALSNTGARANYFSGSDPNRWRANLPLMGALAYREVWPGVDVQFTASGGATKAEYIVSPDGAVESIRLRFDGQSEIRSDGSLVVEGPSGLFREEKPFLFQRSGSAKVAVEGEFLKNEDGTVGYRVGSYDHHRPLIIDPQILFSGYFGGGSQTNTTALAVNSSYTTVVVGWSIATDLPTTGGARPQNAGGVDAFIAGFSPTGGALLFCTYLGGSGDDRALAVAVDPQNNIYVTGWTSSANFPIRNAAQLKYGGVRDAFVSKLSPNASSIIFSTFLGGTGVDVGNSISLDSSNSPIVVGDTTSSNLATTPGSIQPVLSGGQDVFVAKLAASGSSLVFLTYFGGSASDHGSAVRLDASGAIFVGGSTYSPNFPVANPNQRFSGGGQDGFVAKISSSGRMLIFSTYLGGSGGSAGAPEGVNAMAIGPSGSLFVAGTTSSQNLPVTALALQPSFAGGATDGFIARYDPNSGTLQKCTYLGGSSDDGINALAVDNYGYLYVTGFTTSTDFKVVNPIQSANAGGMDAFVAKLIMSQIFFSTYLGGSANDSANAVALDSSTSIVVAGQTGSNDYPALGAVGGWPGSVLSSFVTKLGPNFALALAAAPTYYFDVWRDTGYTGTASNLNLSSFGQAGDIPIAGDWDSSGVERIGVFRNGTWLLDLNGNGVFDVGDKTVQFGQPGDRPVVGDWNGTGKTKLGLFRQGTFILDLSGHLEGAPTGLTDLSFPFGIASDIPVVADWNRSGTSKVGVFRNGLWLVDYNGDAVFNGLDKTYSYGQAGDLPVTGDWASTGFKAIGVFRNGVWILDYSSDNIISANDLILAFGESGQIPIVQNVAPSAPRNPKTN